MTQRGWPGLRDLVPTVGIRQQGEEASWQVGRDGVKGTWLPPPGSAGVGGGVICRVLGGAESEGVGSTPRASQPWKSLEIAATTYGK
jgi:hypothetical protein